MTTDVLIVGNGIAGLVLSTLLEKKGVDHVVLRRQGKVKDFALAEALPPSALPLLDKLGLLELFETCSLHKTYGYHSIWGSDAVIDNNFFFQQPYKYGLKINKQAVAAKLEDRQKGFIIGFEKNLYVHSNDNGVTATFDTQLKTEMIGAKFIVDATGRNRAVLAMLNIPSLDFDTLTSFSCHLPRIKHRALTHSVLIEAFEHGWGIVSGLNENENVVTFFTRKENGVQLKAKKYENWSGIFSCTQYLKSFLSADLGVKIIGNKANSSRAQYLSGSNWLALGDAAISFDPLSSHGITNAVYTAQKASEAIWALLQHGDDTLLTAYESSLSAVFGQYLQTKNQLYSSEKRWKETPFWKSLND